MKILLSILLVSAGFAFSSAQAEEAKPQEPAKAAPAAEQKTEAAPGMMGGKMDMGRMHAMMGECMKMHKDGKMCEGQAMEQCQKTMGMEDCSKMMKKAKVK